MTDDHGLQAEAAAIAAEMETSERYSSRRKPGGTISLGAEPFTALVAGASAWYRAFMDDPYPVPGASAELFKLTNALSDGQRAIDAYNIAGDDHDGGCWQRHHACAVDTVQRLRTAIAMIRNETQRDPMRVGRMVDAANRALDSLL